MRDRFPLTETDRQQLRDLAARMAADEADTVVEVVEPTREDG